MNKKQLFFLLKLILTTVLLLAVINYVDLTMVWERIRSVNPLWLLASLGCLAIGYIMCGIRWAWIAKGLGIDVTTKQKIRLYFLGMFASLFLPSTIGGDVIRGVLLAKGEGRKGIGVAAGASVILDRVNGMYALLLLLTFSMLFFEWPVTWWVTWLSIVGAAWLGMALYPWIDRHLVGRLPEKLERLKALPLMERKFQKRWWQSLPVSFLFQVLIVQAHVFLGMAVGLEMNWFAFSIMVGLVALVATLPISLNGFGVREAGYVSFAVYFGASSDAATAMAALWIIVLALASLPGAWVLWRLGGLNSVRGKEATSD